MDKKKHILLNSELFVLGSIPFCRRYIQILTIVYYNDLLLNKLSADYRNHLYVYLCNCYTSYLILIQSQLSCCCPFCR